MVPAADRPWARFDDLRNGESLLCPTPSRVLTTTRLDEVAGVLQEVHEGTAAGSWAYGYVSYEAAAGLDPRLPGGWTPGQPPLVWFGLCAEPARVDPLTGSDVPPLQTAPWRPDWTAAAHARAVGVVRERIAAGSPVTVERSRSVRLHW
jgi:para-aminobenzoate synthetase/4-amino-4-deoxychorismate lyase